jgi:hypothetical protein
MSDCTTSTEVPPITINVKSASVTKYTLNLPPTTSIIELKDKLAGPDFFDTSATRLRLIYSSRLMIDHDTLDSYNIKDTHTILVVKGTGSTLPQRKANHRTAIAEPDTSASPPDTSEVETTPTDAREAHRPDLRALTDAESLIIEKLNAVFLGAGVTFCLLRQVSKTLRDHESNLVLPTMPTFHPDQLEFGPGDRRLSHNQQVIMNHISGLTMQFGRLNHWIHELVRKHKENVK